MSERPSLTIGSKILVVILALGLGAMLVTSLMEQADHVSVQDVSPQHSHDMPPQGMGQGMGDMSNIGPLMEQAAKEPDNPALLVKLAESLMHSQNWEAAATFARRAIVLKPEDPHTLYLLGVIEHGQGKHKEAAELLEKVVTIQDDPSVRYSLGILYLHYLKQPSQGVEHLSEALHASTASEDLKAAIRKELEEHVPLPAEGGVPTEGIDDKQEKRP